MTDSTYYNRPSAPQEFLKREMPEMDWMTVLAPRSYAVSAGYVLIGTILSRSQSSVILQSVGQAAQILGVFTFIKTMSSLYDAPDSGKGI